MFAICRFNFMWISSFKAISWAFNRGALVTQPFNFAQFLVVYAAPVTPVATDAADKPAQPAEAATPSASAAAGEPSGPAPSVSSKDSVAPAAAVDGGESAAIRKGRLAEDAGGTATMLRVWATKGALLLPCQWKVQRRREVALQICHSCIRLCGSRRLAAPAKPPQQCMLLLGLNQATASPALQACSWPAWCSCCSTPSLPSSSPSAWVSRMCDVEALGATSTPPSAQLACGCGL